VGNLFINHKVITNSFKNFVFDHPNKFVVDSLVRQEPKEPLEELEHTLVEGRIALGILEYSLAFALEQILEERTLVEDRIVEFGALRLNLEVVE